MVTSAETWRIDAKLPACTCNGRSLFKHYASSSRTQAQLVTVQASKCQTFSFNASTQEKQLWLLKGIATGAWPFLSFCFHLICPQETRGRACRTASCPGCPKTSEVCILYFHYIFDFNVQLFASLSAGNTKRMPCTRSISPQHLRHHVPHLNVRKPHHLQHRCLPREPTPPSSAQLVQLQPQTTTTPQMLTPTGSLHTSPSNRQPS
jgi:hypothetical protein